MVLEERFKKIGRKLFNNIDYFKNRSAYEHDNYRFFLDLTEDGKIVSVLKSNDVHEDGEIIRLAVVVLPGDKILITYGGIMDDPDESMIRELGEYVSLLNSSVDVDSDDEIFYEELNRSLKWSRFGC